MSDRSLVSQDIWRQYRVWSLIDWVKIKESFNTYRFDLATMQGYAKVENFTTHIRTGSLSRTSIAGCDENCNMTENVM